MGTLRKFKRRSELEHRQYIEDVKNTAQKIAKTVSLKMTDLERQETVNTAMVYTGMMAMLVIEKNWAKLAPKSTRKEVFARLIRETLDDMEKITTVDGLTDEQKNAGKIMAQALDLPWRI